MFAHINTLGKGCCLGTSDSVRCLAAGYQAVDLEQASGLRGRQPALWRAWDEENDSQKAMIVLILWPEGNTGAPAFAQIRRWSPGRKHRDPRNRKINWY